MLTPEFKGEVGAARPNTDASVWFCNLSSLINVASLICYFILNELLWKIKLQMSPLVTERLSARKSTDRFPGLKQKERLPVVVGSRMSAEEGEKSLLEFKFTEVLHWLNHWSTDCWSPPRAQTEYIHLIIILLIYSIYNKKQCFVPYHSNICLMLIFEINRISCMIRNLGNLGTVVLFQPPGTQLPIFITWFSETQSWTVRDKVIAFNTKNT